MRRSRWGENIATAKGAVLFRNEMFELLQFAPSPENIYARPLVMSPPQINKYYAIDSRPAPKKRGSRKYPPLCPAPGTYVMER